MKQIRSAIAQHLRPSAHILELKQPRGEWSKVDHALAITFQEINDETCDKCGHPLWICRSQDNMLDWSVESAVCYSSAAVEAHENPSRGKPPKKKPGEYFYAKAKMMFGKPLPTREQYYIDLAKESQAHNR